MSLLFGAVADSYDDVRPGYPPAVLDAMTAYHAGVPASVAEIGAGTGKATDLFVRWGSPLAAIEPDSRMAAVLKAKFPQVSVIEVPFEQWTPTPVELIGCGLVWHWLDPATRNQRAFDALQPGGTLAVFAHKYRYADPAAAERLADAMRSTGVSPTERPDHWILDDVTASGLFRDVTEHVFHTPAEFTTVRYLQLTQTFGPFRRRTPELQASYLAALEKALTELGGSVTLDLQTALVLGRR